MPPASLPYKLACLCELRDAEGRGLLLHRLRAPNKGLCSPIGGKLEMAIGESPFQCAQREIMEEAGIEVALDRLHLGGLIAETAFEGQGHWLLFYFRVIGPVEVPARAIDEGELVWHRPEDIDALPLPQTDRSIIWPIIREHDGIGGGRPGFFSVHIDCTHDPITWTVEQSLPPIAGPG